MPAPVFIGDEVTATGYRLAGARIHTPAPERVAETLGQVRDEAALVLVTAEYAARLPKALLDEALAARRPALVIVPDAPGATPMPDLAALIRAQLGLGE